MKVDVRQNNDIVIVDFNGRLVAGVGDELLSQIIDRLLADHWKKILLNLRDVDSIDSNGLGELVQSMKVCQRFGAALHLLEPQERVRKTLHLTRLLPLFVVHDSEEDAVKAFGVEKVTSEEPATGT